MEQTDSEVDEKMCNLMSNLFGISTKDDVIPGPIVGLNKAVFFDWVSDNGHDAAGDARRTERRLYAGPHANTYLADARLAFSAAEKGNPTAAEYQGAEDSLPMLVDPMSMAGLYIGKTFLTLVIEETDSFGLAEWMRVARSDDLRSMSIQPSSWEIFDSKPTGPDLTAQLTLCNVIFFTQFARHRQRRLNSTRDQAPDRFEVYGVPTTNRRRSEDKRRGELRILQCADMRVRDVGFVGDEFSVRGGADRSLPGGPLIGSYNRRQLVPYSCAEDLYLVPSVYRDTSGAFMERHEARLENLAEQGSPKVLLTVVRKDALNPAFMGEDQDSDDSAF